MKKCNRHNMGCTGNFFLTVVVGGLIAVLFACGFIPLVTAAIWVAFGLGIITLVFC